MHRQQRQKHRPIGLYQIKKVAYNSGRNQENEEMTENNKLWRISF